LPGGGGTGCGSRGGFIMSLSLIKECPPVGGHSDAQDQALFVHLLFVGFLGRLLVGLLVWLLPILALLLALLALLALALLLVTVRRGLLRIAVLGIVHR
jgi:hypothetical protein